MTATRRVSAGQVAFHAGQSAELQVAQDYARRGYPLVELRWRGLSGEIDLIVQNGEGFIFVEVKKSRNFDTAARRLSRTQMARIYNAAEEYLAGTPHGALTDVRFDAALVDGSGHIQIIENAFGHD